MSDAEPIVSNIQDAINFMKKQIEIYEAVIDTSKLKAFSSKPMFLIKLTILIIACIIALLIVTILASGGNKLMFIAFPFIVAPCYMFLEWKNIEFLAYKKARDKLVPLLVDLELLRQYDKKMDVGFQLDASGEFNELALKAMMKKRKKEIKSAAKER